MMKLRVLAFALAILAFFIFVGSPFQQSAKAVVLVDDAIVAIVIATLAAFGVTFTFTGGYYTVYDWVAQQIAESGANFTGSSVGVNALGNLLYNNKLVREIQIVCTYIAAKYGFQDNTDITIFTSQVGVLDEISGVVYQPGSYTDRDVWTSGTPILEFYVNNHTGEENEKIVRFDGTYYRITITHPTNRRADMAVDSSPDMVEWTNLSNSTNNNSSAKYTIQLFEEEGKIWLYMKTHSGIAAIGKVVELANVSTGEDLVANIGTLDIPSNTEIGDNYGILTLPLPWGESYQIIINSIPTLTTTGQLEGNTFLDLDSDAVVEGQLDTDLTNEPYVSDNPSDYQTPGLSSVFPFCIPFDIYNFFECLAADPVAPSFTWRFYVPNICDESIEIDLSEFDTAAQILRTMELLAFCVGLAFVTRKIIRG